MTYQVNPELDLQLEREVDLKPEQIWQAWTTPELLKKWFCPLPWKTIEARIDLRPGGEFATTFQSPEGDKIPNLGCFLEVVPNKRLVWTSALKPDFRPTEKPASSVEFAMTAMIILEPTAKGTKYRAIALHADKAAVETHKAMGFEQGWGIALDQLIQTMKAL